MAAAAVQTATQGTGGGASIGVTFSSPTVQGNLVVLPIRIAGASDTCTGVTDDKGNSYVLIGPVTNGSNRLYQAYGVQVVGGVTALTVSFSGASNAKRCGADEYSGCASSNAAVIDQTNSNTGTSTAPACTLSPSAAGKLVVMALGVPTAPTWTIDSNYTRYSGVGVVTTISQYRLSGTASESVTDGISGGAQGWITILTSFNLAAPAQGMFSAVAKGFQVLLYDQDFSLKKELGAWAMPPWWEYNRFGGCGQCQISVLMDSDAYEQLFSPRTSVRILVDGEVRYQGRILKFQRRVSTGVQMVTATFYGYASQLARVIVRETYSNMEVSAIVKDILQNYVDPNTDISYVLSEIQATDFTLTSVVFNHSAQDALVFLGQIAGPFEWGVDRNRKFFWRRQDNVVRRIWMLGREINAYDEERSYENVVNSINVFGRDGYLTTPEAASSQDTFGFSEENHFESAITQPSDGNQLGAVILSGRSGVQRAIGLQYLIPDEFLERNVPIGGVSVGIGTVSTRRKYGASTASRRNKYGVSTSSARNKYGVLTSDQLSNVRYSVNGKGLTVQVTVTQEIPTLATQQKRIQYQINELQRR